jgi:sugar (pentulose or hexulose) kinase
MNAKREDLRGIAVVDIGYTNSKVVLYSPALEMLGERKITSPHHDGAHYREINVQPIIDFAAGALRELDAARPVDKIVVSAHGACIVALDPDGKPAVPVMDYMSEPPPEILKAYETVMPDFAEVFTPPLPMALLHGLQLFWQQQVMPEEFARVRTILPLMQFVAHALGACAVTEVSAMSCQSHLVDMRDGGPSSLAKRFGWDKLYAPEAKAWETIGKLKAELRGSSFQGRGEILAGLHDSNANFLRYLAAGQEHFTLLSTGTWIIGFDTDADIAELDPIRDIVASKNVFGKTISCCRFFGGKEFELVAQGADGSHADVNATEDLIAREVMALPSFTDSGGPVPGTRFKGKIVGGLREGRKERASLASLYCALMVSESLDAIHSGGHIIVDGPFSQNHAFLTVLAALRSSQSVYASGARDGTAAGAACLALIPDGLLPHIDVPLRQIAPAAIPGLKAYQIAWRVRAQENADV